MNMQMSPVRPLSLGSLLLLVGLLFPAGVAAQTTVKYVHTDALGSVVAMTDVSGNVVEGRREYEAYGQQLTPALKDGPGYTGHVQDAATGLVYMQQRYYDPMCGCFLSVDPVTAYSNGDMRFFNRYAYAFNNPYRFTDPDGRSPDTLIDAGFIIYDTGRFLGAAAAWAHGKLTGNDALATAGREGMADTGRDLGVSVASAVVPGLAAPVARGAVNSAEAASDLAKPLKEQAADLVQANGGRNRVEIRSPSEMHRTDLAGKSHGGVDTPHTKVAPRNQNAPNQPAYNTRKSEDRSSTQQDIRNARRYLERKDR